MVVRQRCDDGVDGAAVADLMAMQIVVHMVVMSVNRKNSGAYNTFHILMTHMKKLIMFSLF